MHTAACVAVCVGFSGALEECGWFGWGATEVARRLKQPYMRPTLQMAHTRGSRRD